MAKVKQNKSIMLDERHLLWLLEGNVVTMKNAMGEKIEVSLCVDENEVQDELRDMLVLRMPELQDS